MVGWHHQLNGYEFEETPGDSEGQGSLACCSLMGSQRVRNNLAIKQQQQHISRENNYNLLSLSMMLSIDYFYRCFLTC